jgi:hypothetical protein
MSKPSDVKNATKNAAKNAASTTTKLGRAKLQAKRS